VAAGLGLSAGVPVLVPEISDYEIRRELLRAGKSWGLSRLDQLARDPGYLPISTEVMRLAASFWAEARKQGQSTPPPTSPSTPMPSSPPRPPS
jgi:predicted nucleic acid-binding protein